MQVNDVIVCKVLKSLHVRVHAKLIMYSGLCKTKLPKEKINKKRQEGLQDHALPSHHCYLEIKIMHIGLYLMQPRIQGDLQLHTPQ